VNRRALERQLDTLLPLYKSWGIKGLKFGFVQVGSGRWTAWLHSAVRKAADYNMIVDIHDEYRPTGYSRTYPNLLNQEGIRGDEETIPVEHSITTLFTRMIAGPADNTFCYFTGNRVNKMGSHASQMAKSVCIYSPLPFLYWYDRPGTTNSEGIISEEPELEWFDNLPVSWDETHILESDMESFATIARKKKNEWWVGSLNGSQNRRLRLTCDFLDAGKEYTAIMYSDDPAAGTRTNIRISKTNVNNKSVLEANLSERNGVAIRFVPAGKL
jgi:alpha-glucosidase